MDMEVITDNAQLLIRRLTLAPGEAMFWHRDRCRRFSVVTMGDKLAIEYLHSNDYLQVDVHCGLCGWDEPEDRVHRAVNIGTLKYSEVVTFYRTEANMDPQPEYRE